VSEVKIISPRQNLIEVVAGHLRPRGQDYSSSLVVFPGKRPAHFLRKFLAGQAGSAIVPPRVFSIDHFIEFLLAEVLGDRRKIIDTVDAVAILHDVHLQLDSKLGGASYTTLDAFLPLAMRLFGELEEIVLADASRRQLQEVIRSFKFPKFFPLSEYYEHFYQALEQRGSLTRSTAYRAVADKLDALDLAPFDRIVLAGFYAFTSVERRIVSHLKTLENVVFLFQKGVGLELQLEALHIDMDDVEEPSYTAAQDTPSISFYKAPDEHGQILALATQMKGRVERGEVLDERTVIVLPSAEALFPVIHAPLSLLEEGEYNISLGYPLERTPVFGFLNSLMELVARSFHGKFLAQAYLRFVLHPYTKNIRLGTRSDLTRVLFHRIEEFLAERKAKLLLSLDDLERDETLFDFILKGFQGLDESISIEDLKRHLQTIHDRTIRRFQAFSTLGDFCQRAIDVLTFIFDQSTATRHPYFRPYAQRFVEILDSIRSSLLCEKRFEAPAAYFAFFRQYVAAESVPFAGTPLRGLQVLGLLETRNLQFDTLYVLDANDDILPSRPAEDLLLPQPVRRELGLETNRERERLTRYYFNLAIESAREVHLFYTETKGGKKEKSRFVQKLIWERERTAGRQLADELEQAVKYKVNLANPKPVAVPKTRAIIERLRTWNRFSASQLDTYLACPLRFYYSTVLGLREKAEPTDEVDQRDLGILVHRILRECFAPLAGRVLKPEDLNEEGLDAAIDRCFAQTYGADLLGPALFLRQQVRLQLGRFLERYQQPVAGSTRLIVTAIEERISVERKGIQFTGSIDRVELRDGKPFILDYKTAKDDDYVKIRLSKIELEDRSSWHEGIGSFQLPVYMLLYSEANQVPIEELTPAYIFLGGNEMGAEIEKGIGDGDAAPAEVYAAVEPVMFKMIDEILDVREAFQPTDRLEEECPSCPYSAICGTNWTQAWRRE
jgi:ATP-dependent helicase/nuclease subunit B